MRPCHYDAILFVSFGGPEHRDEVIPFLENVVRGRNIPRERLLAVAEHYHHFDGVSPINQQNRELIAAVTQQLRERGVGLPVYWGNRNWHPLLPDTVQQMANDGIQNAIAFVTAAHSSYSSCRQYLQNIADARAAVGPAAPRIDKIRVFYNHPDFIAAVADRVQEARQQLEPRQQETCRIAFTAHSIPESMAACCDYERQLKESCRLVADQLGIPSSRYDLVYQSRSGRPQDPWLGPDILDYIRALAGHEGNALVIAPIGFLSDHMEIKYDLDVEAQALCSELGLPMARAQTVGTHPRLVTMVRKLIEERLFDQVEREALGEYGPSWDVCSETCCPLQCER